MPIITGRDLTLTIDDEDYNAQASSVVLSTVLDRQRYDVLEGPVYKTTDQNSTLTVEMFQDWGEDGSLCEALWSAADDAPDTPLEFTFTANGGEFTGEVFPNKPDSGGSAPGELTVTVELTVNGKPDYDPPTPPPPPTP
jgi:hypothetical protein